MEYSLFDICNQIQKNDRLLNEELLKHISPLGWEHINFLGEYNFDVKQIWGLNELRPLRQFPAND